MKLAWHRSPCREAGLLASNPLVMETPMKPKPLAQTAKVNKLFVFSLLVLGWILTGMTIANTTL